LAKFFFTIAIFYNLFLNAIAAESTLNDDLIGNELKQTLSNNHSMVEPNFFSMIFGLLLVISLIYITGYIYQKMLKVKFLNKTDDEKKEDIEIVSYKPLGQNKNLYIVKARGEYCLIGATQNNISLLKMLKSNECEYKEKS